MQWRIIHASGHKAIQMLWSLGENSLRRVLGRKGCKDTRACSCQLRRAKLIEPINRIPYPRVQLFNQGLTVIFPALLEEGRYCNGGRVSCQIFMRKNRSGGNVAMRRDYQIPMCGGFHTLQLLADALRPGGFTPHKNGNIRPQLQSQRAKFIEAQPGLPKPVKANQCGGGIAAATADSASHWQAFGQFNFRPPGTPGLFLQESGRPVNQVIGLRYSRQRGGNGNFRMFRYVKAQLVSVIEQLEKRLQGVVAVRPPSGDMEEQVEFGGSRQYHRGPNWGGHSWMSQRLIASTSRIFSREATILRGSGMPFSRR